MSHFAYLAVLLVCLLGTLPLELFLGAKVYRNWRRLLDVMVPVVIVYTIWDVYAIAKGHWTFDSNHITNIMVVAHVPLEEICFFIAIPICSILTYEAVGNVLLRTAKHPESEQR